MGDAVRRAARPITLAAIVLIGVLLGWQERTAPLTDVGDDAIYVTLSQSLEHGRYDDEFLVGTPPHAQYPPGMPAWLLIVRRITGSPLAAPQFASFLLLALTALLFADALRLLGLPWVGVGVAAAVIFNPALVWIGGQLMSETLYLTCSSLALWLSLRENVRPSRTGSLLAVVAALAAFLTRSVGLAMIGAIGGESLLRRRRSALILGGILSVVTIATWFGYTAWAARHSIGHSYATDFSAIANDGHASGLLARTLTNARWYASRLPQQIFGLPDIPGTAWDTWIAALVVLTAIVTGLWQLRLVWTSAVLSVVLSAGIMLIFWPFLRLLVPLVPVLFVAMAVGTIAIGRRLGMHRPEAVALIVMAVFTLIGVQRGVAAAAHTTGCQTADASADEVCFDQGIRSFMAAERYLRDSVPATAIVASSHPSTVYQASGHRGLHLELLLRGHPDSLLLPKGPVTHLLLSRLVSYDSREVVDSLAPLCHRMEVVRKFPPGTLLIAVHLEDVPTNACEEVGRFRSTASPEDHPNR